MLIVLGKAKVAPSALEAARDTLTTMVTETLKEPGCIDYGYAIDLLDPGLIRITEKWRDEEALRSHFGMPHMADFQQAVGRFGVEIVELAKFAADDGSPLG